MTQDALRAVRKIMERVNGKVREYPLQAGFVFGRNLEINTVVVRSHASEVRLLQAAYHRHTKQDSL